MAHVKYAEITKLINVDPLADRWSVSLHALILLSFAAATTYCAQAQNIEGQAIAAQYGEFEVQNEGNGFAFTKSPRETFAQLIHSGR